MKKAIIIGATSGIGQEVAKCLLLDGWQIGVAGRRQSALENLQRAAPDQIQIQTLDVTQEDAGEKLNMLIDKVGGMDLFLLSSGIGFQNTNLNMEVELNTAYTNVEGFIRMVDTAFIYFRKSGGGHLAVISSIAGTKGLGSAAKRSCRRCGTTITSARTAPWTPTSRCCAATWASAGATSPRSGASATSSTPMRHDKTEERS